VGNNNNDAMNGIMGSTGATPIWHYFMEKALEGKDRGTFVKPEKDFVTLEIDALSGMLPGPATEQKKTEIFIKGTEPTQTDTFHETVKVCKTEGKLATDYDIATANVEDKTFKTLIEIKPEWQPYTDAWMALVGGYSKPPTEKCSGYATADNKPYVVIQSPADGATVGHNFTVTVAALSPNGIAKVEFYWDGTLYKTLTAAPFSADYHLATSVLGEHALMVKGYDSAGNVATATAGVTISLEPSPGGPPATPSAGH
jgi:membrane carboxypeptidase/penicillin-binding protein PbpC